MAMFGTSIRGARAPAPSGVSSGVSSGIPAGITHGGRSPRHSAVLLAAFLVMAVSVLAPGGSARAEAAGSWSGFGVCGGEHLVVGLWLRDDGRATFRVRRTGATATQGFPAMWSLDAEETLMMVTGNVARIRFVGRMAADRRSMSGRLGHPADGCDELRITFRKDE